MRGIAGHVAAVLLTALAAAPAGAADPVLAPAGTLRAAWIATNLAQARVDPATGRASGVVADLAAEFAGRAGAALELQAAPSAAAVIAAVREGRAEIGFVAPNPEREGLVRWSRPYMLVQQTALVLDASPLRRVAELDRAGHVIGVNTDDSVGVWLKQRLAAATLRVSPDFALAEGVRWLEAGEIAAFAGGRQRLAGATAGVPGVRLLDDDLYGVPQAIAVPAERDDRLARIDAILDELRRSGFLAAAVARSGVVGLAVAPAD